MSKRKLLLADDSMTIQKVVNLTFADEGIEVFTVGNGSLAIEKLSEIEPDLVLADVHMPGLTGYEVCEQIKTNPRFQHIPVMLLVGSFEPFDEREAERVGANDFLTKPFQSIRQLIQKVTTLLADHSNEENQVVETGIEPVVSDDSNELQMSATADFKQSLPTNFAETAIAQNPQTPPKIFDLAIQDVSFGDAALDDEMIETNSGNNLGNDFAADRISSNQFDLQSFDIVQTSNAASEQQNQFGNQASKEPAENSETAEMRQTEPLSYHDIQEMNYSMLAETPEPPTQDAWQNFQFETNVVSEIESNDQSTEVLSVGHQAPDATDDNSNDTLNFEFDSSVSQPQFEEQLLETADFEFVNVEESSSIENRLENSAEELVDFDFAANSQTTTVASDNEPLELDLDEINLLQIDDEDSILDLQSEQPTTDLLTADLDVLPASNNASHSPNNQLAQVVGQTISNGNLDFPPHVIEAIAKLVIEKLSDKVIEKIAWEIVPDRFDLIVRQQIENRSR